MVTSVVLESVGRVVALSALSTPRAAGTAHAASTPDTVSVSSCKQTKITLWCPEREKQESTSIKNKNQRQTEGSSRCSLSWLKVLQGVGVDGGSEDGQDACFWCKSCAVAEEEHSCSQQCQV